MRNDYAVILTTVADQTQAQELAALLVEQRWAACVQMLPIHSCYRWKEQVMKDEEILLLIKTRAHLYEKVEAFIKEHHRYEVPEIIQLPVQQGFAPYLNWVTANTKGE
ncbi:MAG: divalent-cation tolerance protein CutA [Chloroflexi bacterium]|nr:divalent-cation tolerance protein CutA [Chloroflexota bacterium]